MGDSPLKKIDADGTETELPDAKPDLKTMQGWVGGYVEIVRLREPGMIMVVDEEGRLKNKPVNRKASQLSPLPYQVHGDVVVMPESYFE